MLFADTCSAPSCDNALAGSCALACGVCGAALIPVAPGATFVREWSGTAFELTDLATRCDDACAEQCVREVAAPAGRYRAFAPIWLECPLMDGCACPPGASEPCLVPYESPYTDPVPQWSRTVEVELALPREAPVELVVD